MVVLGALVAVALVWVSVRLVGEVVADIEAGSQASDRAAASTWLGWMMLAVPLWGFSLFATAWGRQAGVGRVLGSPVAWGIAVTGPIALGVFGLMAFGDLMSGEVSDAMLGWLLAFLVVPVIAWGYLLLGPRDPAGPVRLY